MPVTTVSAAVHITPVVVKTFFSHGKRKAQRIADSREDKDPQDDIFFDEAFNITKSFIELGTKNTVESLQAFTNTHVPAPYWAAVAPVLIPMSTCNRAADVLIDWFGSELDTVVGGSRWFQVRGLDGVEGEWITEKEYLGKEKLSSFSQSSTERLIGQMDDLQPVMLYIHGGGYFWGSINTHRYQLIRYARKINGRVFAVNYRKAPQYPWPCPLQDVLAAYLYLTNPPPNATHTAVDPHNIVIGGDSAGGGLTLTLLTILRDMGLPLPAGGVLISPWVDLTHSFPSVMQNMDTDIIPAHGFLAKPSTLWPLHPLPTPEGRVAESVNKSPPKPGHADTLDPTPARVKHDQAEAQVDDPPQTQEKMIKMPVESETHSVDIQEEDYDTWEPKPPKVLMDDPKAIPLELRSQIQLYATNEQLTHPLVSPILQGSLCNLPPLYIIAGDGELLRDEIIYLAHRAAYPTDYPPRRGALQGHRQKENKDKFTTPTKVHLQVFDGMCHVLTVFSFAKSPSSAYRSIADFVKQVTTRSADPSTSDPFPPLRGVAPHSSSASSSSNNEAKDQQAPRKSYLTRFSLLFKRESGGVREPISGLHDCDLAPRTPNDEQKSLNAEGWEKKETAAQMIRQRVDIRGRVRNMEPQDQVEALKVQPGQVGIIKQAPALRWAKGQDAWDVEFKASAERVIKRRKKLEAKYQTILEHAREKGLVLKDEYTPPGHERAPTSSSNEGKDGTIQEDRRWGPLDLDDENPPPSSIVKRRDTPEALALLKKTIYHTAPVTHRTIPKLKAVDAVRAAFDPNDDPKRPPRQSASEQQVHTHIIPIHGLKIWDLLVGYFMKESTKKARKNTRAAASAVGSNLGITRKDSTHTAHT